MSKLPLERCQDSVTDNRRTSVRFPCPQQSARPAWAVIDNEPHGALIMNFSLGGVGLLLSKRIQPGTPLRIRVGGRAENPTPLAARVIHATAREDGFWVLGCAFEERLSVGELRTFLI
jgi:hypothetical protein